MRRIVQPIAVVRLDDAVVEALDRLAESAAGASLRGDVLELVSDCFRAGERLSDSFARLLAACSSATGSSSSIRASRSCAASACRCSQPS